MRAGGGTLQLLHRLFHSDDTMAGSKTPAAPGALGAASPPVKWYGAPATSRGGVRATTGSGREGRGDLHSAGSYLGAEAAALLACVTATLLVLPLLLPPLPPPPTLFLLVPVAIFAVLVLLVLVPSDATSGVNVGSLSSSPSSYL